MNSLVAQTVKHLPTMQETRVRFLGWEDSLEKEMATHSNIPAWKIPWTEDPGGLQSMGVKKSWTRLSTHTNVLTKIIKELSTHTHNTLISFPERSLQNLLSSPKLLSFKGTFQGKCLKFMLSIAVIFLQEFQVWYHILISCS